MKHTPLLAVGSCVFLLQTALCGEPKGGHADEGGLQTCFAMAADFTPVYATAEFPAVNGRVGAPLPDGVGRAKLEVRWLAVEPGATPRELTAYTLDLRQGSDRGWISYSPSKPLAPGRYQFEVHADGKPWKSRDFGVVGPPKGFALSDPEDLLPLAEGLTWR